MSDGRVLYFAYGSNMDADRLQKRVGKTGEGVRCTLEGYELRFNKRNFRDYDGRANIVEVPGAVMEGVLFEMSTEQFAALDGNESGYVHLPVSVVRGGTRVEAQAYIATPAYLFGDHAPSEGYLAHIVQGARAHGLSEAYIEDIRAKAAASRGDAMLGV